MHTYKIHIHICVYKNCYLLTMMVTIFVFCIEHSMHCILFKSFFLSVFIFYLHFKLLFILFFFFFFLLFSIFLCKFFCLILPFRVYFLVLLVEEITKDGNHLHHHAFWHEKILSNIIHMPQQTTTTANSHNNDVAQ